MIIKNNYIIKHNYFIYAFRTYFYLVKIWANKLPPNACFDHVVERERKRHFKLTCLTLLPMTALMSHSEVTVTLIPTIHHCSQVLAQWMTWHTQKLKRNYLNFFLIYFLKTDTFPYKKQQRNKEALFTNFQNSELSLRTALFIL